MYGLKPVPFKIVPFAPKRLNAKAEAYIFTSFFVGGRGKARRGGRALLFEAYWSLELFVKFAGRAGDVDSAGDAAFTVFDPLDDAGGFVALGTVG
jgi:hypothetical protein